MRIEKPVENWTRYPNCILDNLPRYTSAEIKVVCFMVRKNLGYSNTNNCFSISYLMRNTGLSKQTVLTAVKGLCEKGSITQSGKDERGTTKYIINWTEPGVQKLDQSKNHTTTGLKIRHPEVQKLDTEKEHYGKNTIERNVDLSEKNKNYIYLAELLYTEHLKHDSKYLHGKDKAATFNRWANDIRMLIESDGRTPAEVENTIRWSQSDGCFWIPNILSGKKLREKFPVLWAQSMKAKKTNGKSEKYFSKNEELYKGIM